MKRVIGGGGGENTQNLGDLLFFIRVKTLVIGVCKHLPWCSEVFVSLILNCCCQISIVVAVSILCCVNKVVVVVFVESFCCETCWPPYLPASNTSICNVCLSHKMVALILTASVSFREFLIAMKTLLKY